MATAGANPAFSTRVVQLPAFFCWKNVKVGFRTRVIVQRWLWNESLQLQRRNVKFNIDQLIKCAEQAAGSHVTCVNITKLQEGNFSAFLATMSDGQQLIVKIPNPKRKNTLYHRLGFGHHGLCVARMLPRNVLLRG
ncbi:hypothetical protein VTO42DRAFT_2349 [Malbranchea cinnamomea]